MEVLFVELVRLVGFCEASRHVGSILCGPICGSIPSSVRELGPQVLLYLAQGITKFGYQLFLFLAAPCLWAPCACLTGLVHLKI